MYAFGQLPETASDNEEAERCELMLIIWITQVNSSPNVGDVIRDRRILIPVVLGG